MRMGKKAKFSPCERKFVYQHKMVRNCKPVIQLVHNILPGGHGEENLPKFCHKLAFDFLGGVSSPLALATGKIIPFLLFFRMKMRIETMQNLHNNVQ